MRFDPPDPASRVAAVTVLGDVDFADAGALLRCVRQGVVAGAFEIILDLSAVTYMDSIGLRDMVASLGACAAAGVLLSIRAPATCVARILEMTGLSELFPRARPA
ncbi:MAG: anti-sigma-factor antagonist [Pseudonocardiales bacterium]|nr:anti-sigma-factor antagonist [Jatrophihabitantaceae bacterium]MCW2601951.1 anti-sigma-factor antagonist [Pseudonocardiales bacterium]